MKTSRLLLLCILGATLLSIAVSESEIGPEDCCFKYYRGRIKKGIVVSYFLTDYRCPRTGVILVTKNNRQICVDPNVPWVESIMQTVDESNV